MNIYSVKGTFVTYVIVCFSREELRTFIGDSQQRNGGGCASQPAVASQHAMETLNSAPEGASSRSRSPQHPPTTPFTVPPRAHPDTRLYC